VTERLFFYGTLMAGFDRRRTAAVDHLLRYVSRGHIAARLYDLGEYPAAVAADGRSWGELYETDAPERVLPVLDEIEGCLPGDRANSLYSRHVAEVSLADGSTAAAWVYFYNGSTEAARVIPSGDYAAYLASERSR
jgi:gamma-glutamylcyclotransferase (GGCT)/AIG2-like uncharacterized protein YtfP